jgi:alkylation response protein AidB-like acyl-CoA dehydrogenase
MNFHISPELEALRARVRQFVNDELIPLELEAEMADGKLTPEQKARIHSQMIAAGLNGMCLPKEMGGRGFSYLEQVVTEEELGKATNGLWDLVYSPAVCLAAATPAQVERYVRPTCAGKRRDAYAITEANAGSDPSIMETQAVRDPAGQGASGGGDWLINGEKWHVTSADVADYIVVQADTAGGLTLFFVDKDTPGVTVIERPRYMHTFVVEHLKLRFDNVRVPEANVLGKVGEGLELTKDWFRRERLIIAARCCGAARRLIDEASAFAQSRVQFGHPISEYQAIQFMLADSLTELWAARLMTCAAAQAEDEVHGEETRKLSHVRAAMVKLYASEMAGRVADRAVQIFGGRGYMRENTAERFYRELRVDRIWEGTSEIQRLIIARSLFKRGAQAHLE